MIFDVNAWVGTWPFRSLSGTTPEALVARMDRAGIRWSAVSSIESALHRNVQPANEQLVAGVAPFADRLIPLATINPTYVGWERDLAECHEAMAMKGVRLFPQYHGYEVDSPEFRRVASACRERNLPLCLAHRLEDPRQRHWTDPGKMVNLDQLADLILAEPGVTVIITNARGIRASAFVRRPELRELKWFFDLSLAEVHANLVGEGDIVALLREAGTQHLLFGSHTPFSYEACALVKRAVLPADEPTKAEISYRAALRLFGMA